MDPILNVIDEALARKQLSDAAASKLAVGNASLIKNMRAPADGEKRYSLPALRRLADILDLEFYFGPRRVASGQPGLAEDGQTSDLQRREALRGGWLPIPWHNADPRPGSAPVAFAREWLDHHELVPDRLAMVFPVQNRSGATDQGSETLALVDRLAPRQGGPHLWALRDAKSITLRKTQFDGRDFFVLPAVLGETARLYRHDAADPPTILGRVLWTGTLL